MMGMEPDRIVGGENMQRAMEMSVAGPGSKGGEPLPDEEKRWMRGTPGKEEPCPSRA